MEDSGDERNGGENAERNPRLDYLAHEQVNPARKKGKSGDFARRTTYIEQELAKKVSSADGRSNSAFGNCAEQGRSAECVRAAYESLRNGPVGHNGREGYKQKYTGGKRRVEKVLTETSEGHLDDSDGKHGTYYDYPPRSGRRQVHCQQQARNDGRTVSNGVRLAKHPFGYGPLEQHAGKHADGENEQFVPSVEQHGNDYRRHQRNDDIPHKGVGMRRRMQVR